MIAVFSALVPVFLVIALGWGLRRRGFPGEAFWAPAERLTYFVLFPALLVHSLATAQLDGFSILPLAAALVATVLLTTLILMGLRRRLGADGPAFTSVVQGAIRANTYVGIAAAFALYGDAGLTLAALAIAVLVPTVNVISVAVLSRYAGQVPAGPGAWLAPLARNPLIIGCAAGIALNASGVGLPYGLAPTLDVLGHAALPLGLMAVGAGLDLDAARAAGGLVRTACGLKLLVMPVIAWAACAAFGVEGLTATVAVLFAALPGAPASFVLARELGGDTRLMASIITASVIAAALTMPVMLWLLT